MKPHRASPTHWPSTLVVLSARLATSLAVHFVSAKLVPPFDSSHLVLELNSNSGSPGKSENLSLRWDAIHYASIALNGYEFEQQLAFLPLWPAAMRIAGAAIVVLRTLLAQVLSLVGTAKLTYGDLEKGAKIINLLSTFFAAKYLYKLTRGLTGSHRFASISCIFYALSPHPAASIAPYTEPLYAALTFVGFYHALIGNFARSTVFLALTSGIRATGITNIGVLGWMILFGKDNHTFFHLPFGTMIRRLLIAVVCCLAVLFPFLAFQYYAFVSFCGDTATYRPWCDARIPFSYGFVQAEYWNIGFLKYWTIEQLPNFLLAAPVLIVSLIPTLQCFKIIVFGPKTKSHSRIYHPALLPFHIHHLALTILFIVQSHTQIALRVSITDPVVWWNVSTIAFEWPKSRNTEITNILKMSRAGKLWIAWAVIWGAISVFLWAGHYPPA